MVMMNSKDEISSISNEALEAEITKRIEAKELALSERATKFIEEYKFFSKLSTSTKNGTTRTFVQLDKAMLNGHKVEGVKVESAWNGVYLEIC
tara:strand:+ start:169 stop:447 length:279 start_codon:yes stop_codon:yes gene_type:complete